MSGFIKLELISPVSNYEFSKNNKYLLVLTSITPRKNIIINNVPINTINNVNQTIRGYLIKKTVKISD